jgi:hypothetical protein
MKVICAKYKSQAVEYMQKNKLTSKDVVVVCNESDFQGIRGLEVDEIVELYPKSLLYNVDEVKKIITVKKSTSSAKAKEKVDEKPKAEKKEQNKVKK